MKLNDLPTLNKSEAASGGGGKKGGGKKKGGSFQTVSALFRVSFTQFYKKLLYSLTLFFITANFLPPRRTWAS